MKLAEFEDIPGNTPEEKLGQLFELTNRGPVYVQRKLNGVHFDYRNGVFTTKNGKVWRQGFFGQLIADAFASIHNPTGRILHGEIVAEQSDTKLATLAGWVNVNSELCSDPEHLRFVIYDSHREDYAEPFSFRMRQTQLLNADRDYMIETLETIIAPDVRMAQEIYEHEVQLGGEGVVYRINPDYYYDGTSVSTCAWRRKQWFETEGVIIAVGQGVGKREGMLGGLVVQITLYDGRQVRLSVGGGKELTNTQLTKMWLDRDKLLGMMATIKYQELSIHSTPLRAQLVCIRNYE